jgi:outer membrane autotransporter protein
MAPRLLLVVVGALVALPSAVTGQVCSGVASFAQGPFQVVGSAAFNDEAKTFGGGLAFGGVGAFGQLSIGTTSFDNLEGSSFTFSGGGGYQFSLDERNIVHLCPIASVAFASGPNDIDVFGDGSLVLDLSETDFEFGVALGAVASRSGQTQIIPAGSLAFVSATLKAKDQVSGASDSQSETFGLLGLGLGFVFNRVTVRPGVAIPFGLDGASTTFGVTLSVNFGQRPQ